MQNIDFTCINCCCILLYFISALLKIHQSFRLDSIPRFNYRWIVMLVRKTGYTESDSRELLQINCCCIILDFITVLLKLHQPIRSDSIPWFSYGMRGMLVKKKRAIPKNRTQENLFRLHVIVSTCQYCCQKNKNLCLCPPVHIKENACGYLIDARKLRVLPINLSLYSACLSQNVWSIYLQGGPKKQYCEFPL